MPSRRLLDQPAYGRSIAGGHEARVIARLSRDNSEQRFEAGGLVDELCVSRQNHQTASHRCSCRAEWSRILLARITGIRPPEGVREPWPEPVEALHVVPRKRSSAARAGQLNSRNSLPAVPDHRVEPPAGIDRSLYFPVPGAIQVTPPLPMQSPADSALKLGKFREPIMSEGSFKNPQKRSR